MGSKQLERTCAARAVQEAECLSLTLSDEERAYYREVGDGSYVELDQPAPSDLFELLGVDTSADSAEVKAAFRALQRLVHPDIAGEAATELAMLLNSAYTTLMDESARRIYQQEVLNFRQEGGGFNGRPISRWAGDATEQRAIFVDESTCIGCRHCTLCAPNTFFMEEDYGRARVHTQWADSADEVMEAVDMCPVDCISYVSRQQVALLEYTMRFCQREDIAIMARRRGGNFGPARAQENPFKRAEVYLRHRKNSEVPLGKVSSHARMQDLALAATIARAFLKLPPDVRKQGWPDI